MRQRRRPRLSHRFHPRGLHASSRRQQKKRRRKSTKEATDAGTAADALQKLPDTSRRWQLELLRLVTSALHKCFQHDLRGSAMQSAGNSKFVSKARVELIRPSLVKQLALSELDADYVGACVVPCLGQLAAAAVASFTPSAVKLRTRS